MSNTSSSSATSHTSSGVEIGADGSITVVAGAVVSGLTVSGVTAYVYGTTSDTHVVGFEMSPQNQANFNDTPGVEIVESGGTSIHSYIDTHFYSVNGMVETASASETVMDGGTSISATIQGGHILAYIGGAIGDAFLTASAAQTVESGGRANGTQILDNGVSDVLSGGFASDTTLAGTMYSRFATPIDGNWRWIYYSLDAVQTVENGGSSTDIHVSGSGVSDIMSGGSATHTVLQGGTISSFQQGPSTPTRWVYIPALATQNVHGTSEDIQVGSNGLLAVDGTAISAQVTSGGRIVGETGGTLEDISIGSGGILELGSGVILRDPVTVQSSAAFIFDDITVNGGTFSAAVIPEGSGSAHLQILSGGAILKDIEITGDISGPIDFTTAASGNHLEVGFGTPCYCPGTLIATPSGERAVETLDIGDLILTASGEHRPIRWIGRRAYDPLFAHGNRDVLPIRICRNALAPGLPKRDLTISPLHAMFLDGRLVPAMHLVNGRTITQLTHVTDPIRYIHIELETHDLLLAEGAASESFLDDGSRGMFHNASEYADRYPGGDDRPVRYCAPRVESGPELAKIREALEARARSLDAPASDAPASDSRASDAWASDARGSDTRGSDTRGSGTSALDILGPRRMA